jgi:hypothetical protein
MNRKRAIFEARENCDASLETPKISRKECFLHEEYIPKES